MRTLLFICLFSLPIQFLSAATAPPCEYEGGAAWNFTPPFRLPQEPAAPLQPVPASGTFTCGTLVFSNFSSNVLNGGLIGASFVVALAPTEEGVGEWAGAYVLFEVQPASAALGWSYSVSGDSFVDQVRWISLPPLNHVTSGDPSVTEHFCTSSPCVTDDYLKLGALTATPHSSGQLTHANVPGTVFVQVNPSDITGGTISALDTIFVTPEPISLVFVGSGFVSLLLYRRRKR